MKTLKSPQYLSMNASKSHEKELFWLGTAVILGLGDKWHGMELGWKVFSSSDHSQTREQFRSFVRLDYC